MRSNRIRTTALAATALLAALSLTACNGEDSAAGASGSTPPAASTGGQADQKPSAKGDAEDSSGDTETIDGTSSTNAPAAKGPDIKTPDTKTPAKSSSSARTVCKASNTKLTLTPVSRPVNHMLLTVTNTGSKNCDAYYYPALRFGEAQSVPPVYEDSKPQAVVTLAPGESGYAGVMTSSADGSGTGGYSTKDLSVGFAGKGGISDSAGPAAVVPLSKSVYVDSTLKVTYWQREMSDALSW